jgi:hypothetical protein
MRPRSGSPPGEHQDQPADLGQERPEEQPQIVEVGGAGLQRPVAQPCDQLGEVRTLGLGLGGNLVGGLDLFRLQLGDFGLTRLTGDHLAEPSALAKTLAHVNLEIVKRPDTAVGFKLVPQRWIVERTIAWLNRCRRLAKDWENLNRKALAFLRLASIRLMLRKLCNPA